MTFYEKEMARIKSTVYSNQAQLDTVIATRNYINRHYNIDLNLNFLSLIRFTSKYHLLRLFKKYYGQTPKQYLTDKRIEKSKECLQSGMTITDTCYSIGFESASSFSTLFKSRTGLTPTEFQKKSNFRKVALPAILKLWGITQKYKQMKVQVIGIPVLNQDKALRFYTEKLSFVKKTDVPLGNGNRWLTVVSKEQQDGPEVLLEPAPNHFEPAKIYQKALFDAGIPYTQFHVQSVQQEYERLVELGVAFSVKPSEMGTVKIAVFNDTCGNNIQIVEML